MSELPVPGAPADFEWTCGMCEGVTRDSYVVAEGYMTDLCVACRGFLTITPEAAQAQIDARVRRSA